MNRQEQFLAFRIITSLLHLIVACIGGLEEKELIRLTMQINAMEDRLLAKEKDT